MLSDFQIVNSAKRFRILGYILISKAYRKAPNLKKLSFNYDFQKPK